MIKIAAQNDDFAKLKNGFFSSSQIFMEVGFLLPTKLSQLVRMSTRGVAQPLTLGSFSFHEVGYNVLLPLEASRFTTVQKESTFWGALYSCILLHVMLGLYFVYLFRMRLYCSPFFLTARKTLAILPAPATATQSFPCFTPGRAFFVSRTIPSAYMPPV